MPIVIGAISSFPSTKFRFPSQIGKRSSRSRRRGGINRYLYPLECRGLEDDHPWSSSSSSHQSFDSYKSSFCTSYGRRGLAAMAAIPFIFRLHWLAQAVDADAGESSIVQNGVRGVLSKAKSAGILRMAFHDAGTFDMDDNSGGMNGSIVYELDRPENVGLSKSVKILEKAKREIDKIQQVSWADLVAVAGAEAVSFCGGPVIPIRLGRIDAMMPDPQGKLPQESLDASGLKRCFLQKGFSTQELVALSGAHTLGSKGFGNPNVFDNAYFKILLDKPWTSSSGMSNMVGLPSDRALVEDDECLRWIKRYAGDEAEFFEDFKKAYIKLVNSGALWRGV